MRTYVRAPDNGISHSSKGKAALGPDHLGQTTHGVPIPHRSDAEAFRRQDRQQFRLAGLETEIDPEVAIDDGHALALTVFRKPIESIWFKRLPHHPNDDFAADPFGKGIALGKPQPCIGIAGDDIDMLAESGSKTGFKLCLDRCDRLWLGFENEIAGRH